MMKKYIQNQRRYIQFLALIIIAVFSLAGCGIDATVSKEYIKQKEFNNVADEVVTSNDSYVMSWDNEYKRISVFDKSGVKVFSTSPETNETALDEFGVPMKRHPWIDSPILVTYITGDTFEVRTASAYSDSIEMDTVSSEKIQNGIRVTYFFEDISISVPVNYILNDNSIDISVDTGSITEGEEHVLSVAIAPMACSIQNDSDDNNYLFYPSGSGALIYPHSYDTVGQRYSAEVYGDDATRENYGGLSLTEDESVRLPVYGAKNNNNAVCAVIKKGAEAAGIECWSGSTSLQFSTVYPDFSVRGYEWSERMTMDASKIYSNFKTNEEISVSYYFLSGDDASYIGMANVYRQYLIDEIGMQKSEETPISLKFYGGYQTTKSFLGIQYKKFLALTKLEDVKKITAEIMETADVTPSVQLVGFGSDGLSVKELCGGFTINSALGSEKELGELSEWSSDSKVNLYFDFDALGLSAGNIISRSKNCAIASNGSPNAIYNYNIATRKKLDSEDKFYLIKREKVGEVISKIIDKSKDLGIYGISLSSLSNTAYSDYSNSKYFCKGNMSEDVIDYLSSIRKENYKIAANDANAYAAAMADIVIDTPAYSAKSFAFDADIPFYSIVFKGYRAMTTSPLNLTSSVEDLVLKAAESGIGLGYSVLSEYDGDLFDSYNPDLAKSQYSTVLKIIQKYGNEYFEYFNAVKGAAIKNHFTVGDNVAVTRFDNGISVYVNYSEQEQEVDGVTIPEKSFRYIGA